MLGNLRRADELLPAFSEIRLSAKCLADTAVQFSIKNIGDAPTQQPHEYLIFRNTEIFKTGNFQLANQQQMLVSVKADGATYRMEATKLNNGSKTATALENCGGLTAGQITQFWLEKGGLDYDFDCRMVIGSFDPNQKTVVPTGAGNDHLTEKNTPLRYTIEFQNTGTDTAFRVLLRDLLPADLDVATFRPLASSHPCSWEIKNLRQLEVLFSPIALPDSNVNESASHGFFSFEIGQEPNLTDGTRLENTANIIFDFNPPIITNTVINQIGRIAVRAAEPPREPKLWQVLGNPISDRAIFRTLKFVEGEKTFELFNTAGSRVRLAKFSGQQFDFRREGLAGGLYFFKICDSLGRVFAGKIVVSDF